MKPLITVGGPDRDDASVNEGKAVSDAIVVYDWDADTFHRRVLDLEKQGYVVRRETYRITPEMNPETGQIVHLHTVEMRRAGLDGAVSHIPPESTE